jgi:two-component system, cell cycle response regulator
MFNPARSTAQPVIVLADADEDLRDNVSAMLAERGITVRSADSADDAIELVDTHSPDVLVIDPTLLTSDGVDVLSVIGEDGLDTAPVIVINTDDPQVLRDGIERGAYDQLSRSSNEVIALARIDAAIHTKKLRDEVLYQRGALERLVRVDALTGLTNRSQLEIQLRQLGSTAKRHNRDLSIVLMDIDRFSRINDLAGNDAGDQLLQDVARHVMADIRIGDIAGRWDGDQFMVVLPETPLGGATVLAERLRLTIADIATELPDGSTRPISASFGCAQADEAPALIRQAGSAITEAKRAGGNAVRR